ncbi:hypothetical protein BIFADO_01111 [Bifidobacterium adolescentis L2-32]|uniref:Uncharacterized protein n=1 Tax=Bifidobacterium adolescentis L2-32 TaxID=411481 RepID=A7A5J2_BIFAD|nr:hypothetical protein BIFADO_01111 [Bifidobacterium adolescentis L2-32]
MPAPGPVANRKTLNRPTDCGNLPPQAFMRAQGRNA